MGVRELGQRGKESFLLPFDKLLVLPDWNCREEYGDLEGLAADILANGFQENLKGYYCREADKFVITNGHRRYKAVELLRQRGEGLDLLFPVFCEPKEKLEVELLATQISCSNVLPFNEREKGLVMRKMLLKGATYQSIAEQTGMKLGQVEWCICLATLPRTIFELYRDGILTKYLITATVQQFGRYEGDVVDMLVWVAEKIKGNEVSAQVVADLVRCTTSPEEVLAQIEAALSSKSSKAGYKKLRRDDFSHGTVNWGKKELKRQLTSLLISSKPYIEDGTTYHQITLSEEEYQKLANAVDLSLEEVGV